MPVLFITFNRPSESRRALEAIRSIKPTKLYVASDSPRPGNPQDIERVASVRSIVKEIDWDCQCEYLFQEKNLGCGRGPATAIDWFFDNVEAGIILEDDCVATDSFFVFCKEMLERYVDDDRIMAVAGANVTRNIKYSTSYVYSNFPIMWGWATWRRAWKKYDFDMVDWPTVKRNKSFSERGSEKWKYHPVFIEFFQKTYEKAARQEADVWDHQWIFCNWRNHGLTVTPTKNLVKNIGFGVDATHTIKDDLGRGGFATHIMLPPYFGPKNVEAHREIDAYIAKHWFTATCFYYLKILLLRIDIVDRLWRRLKA